MVVEEAREEDSFVLDLFKVLGIGWMRRAMRTCTYHMELITLHQVYRVLIEDLMSKYFILNDKMINH